MTTKVYSIETLLVGTSHYSNSRRIEGIIQYAEKREGLYYGEGLEAYAIQVRPNHRGDFWSTICVRVSD